MIEFSNVTKKYNNKTTALSDVSLKIDKGEFVFVVGSSGAGKSTFLKLMMREEVPTSGTIDIDGTNLNKIKRRNIPKFRRKLGVVFQDFRLIPTMTVFDNVAFAMRVIGTKEKKIRRRVPYLLSLMGLSEKARNYPRELSGGEQQRVALARALANDAEIIIADEPTGNVDPQMSYEIVDLLMRLNEAGTTVIMVTHEHSLVKCFDKRVIILDRGSVVSDGGALSHEAATAHINPVSEMSSEYNLPPEEDYSAYADSSARAIVNNEPIAEPEKTGGDTVYSEFDFDSAAGDSSAEESPAPAAEDKSEIDEFLDRLDSGEVIPAGEEQAQSAEESGDAQADDEPEESDIDIPDGDEQTGGESDD